MTTLREGGVVILARSPLSWPGLGALLMGILLARWAWIFFAPQAIAISVIPEQGAALEAGRLFGRAASGVTSAEGMALSNVQLVGVFAANPGKPGFAILRLDDKRQVGVAVGGVVVPGTKLFEVHADHVVLESGGIRQRVSLFGNRPSGGEIEIEGNRVWGKKGMPKRDRAETVVPERVTLPEKKPVQDNNNGVDKGGKPESTLPASGVPVKIGMPR